MNHHLPSLLLTHPITTAVNHHHHHRLYHTRGFPVDFLNHHKNSHIVVIIRNHGYF
jgi:hypothetical protein